MIVDGENGGSHRGGEDDLSMDDQEPLNSSFQLAVTEINFNAMFKGLFAPKDKRTPQEKVRIVLETMTA